MSLAPVGDQESVRLQIVGVPDECGVALIELFPLKSGEPPGIQVVAGGVHGVGHYRPRMASWQWLDSGRPVPRSAASWGLATG